MPWTPVHGARRGDLARESQVGGPPMCGLSIQHSDPEVWAGRFDPERDPVLIGEHHPRHQLAPTQPALAIRADARGRHTAAFLHLGVAPYWSKGPDQQNQTINARADTVAEKPA